MFSSRDAVEADITTLAEAVRPGTRAAAVGPIQERGLHNPGPLEPRAAASWDDAIFVLIKSRGRPPSADGAVVPASNLALNPHHQKTTSRTATFLNLS